MIMIAVGFGFPAIARAAEVKPSSCPQDLPSLTTLLLRDLPSYANRVTQRSRRLRLESTNSYVIIAGNPDFNPLNTDINPPLETTPPNSNQPNNQELRQVFFTTLNREYQGSRIVEVQEFHRLFLVQTSRGWQLALMYSRSSTQSQQNLTPTRESMNSAVGQAVITWLRDCQAGTIRSHE